MSRSTQIQVRLTPEEKVELEAKAARHGLSVSAYLRAAALQRGEQGGIGNIGGRTTQKPKGPVASIFEGDDG